MESSPAGFASRADALDAAECLNVRRSKSSSSEAPARRSKSSEPDQADQLRGIITHFTHLEQQVCARLFAVEQKLEMLAAVEEKLERQIIEHWSESRSTAGLVERRDRRIPSHVSWQRKDRNSSHPHSSECSEQRTGSKRSHWSEKEEEPFPSEALQPYPSEPAEPFPSEAYPSISSLQVENLVPAADGSSPGSPPRTSASTSEDLVVLPLAMQVARNVLTKNSSRGWAAVKIWNAMEPEAGDGSCRWFVRTWPLLIMAGVVFGLIQELQVPPWRSAVVAACDMCFDGLFTLEILLRFLVCPDRFAFFLSPFNYIDLAAGPTAVAMRIAAIVLSEDNSGDGRVDLALVVSCVTPVLRLLKMLRRFEKFHLLLSAFQIALEALPVLLFTLLLIILIFSAGIYWCEPRDNIANLSSAMWLTVVTMTTVGYGDKAPKSDAGYVIVSLLMIFSALYMAMPIGIVGNAFNRVWEDRDRLLLLQRFRQHLGQKGYTARDIPELFLFFDEDRDGQLSFEEFAQMMCSVQLGIRDERLVKLFSLFDRNGNGSIDDAEFVRALFPQTFFQMYGPLQDEPEPARRGSVQGAAGFRERRPEVTELSAFRPSAMIPVLSAEAGADDQASTLSSEIPPSPMKLAL